MPASRPLLLASAAAAVLVAAACSGDASAPAGPTIAGVFSVSADTAGTDSVVAGYGTENTGGYP